MLDLKMTSQKLKQIVNQTVAKALQQAKHESSESSEFLESESPTGSAKFQNFQKSEKNQLVEKKQWNSKNVKYFDSNFEKKWTAIEKTLTHSNKNIYYKNVHIFVKCIKKMTIVLETKQIRRNLFSCLCETILMWHIAELSNTTRRILIYEKKIDEWMTILIVRFKPQASTITTDLFREKYIMKNARRFWKFKKYAQKIIKSVKSAKLNSIFNQLNVMYNGIDVKLRRNLKRPLFTITLNDYFQKFDDFKNIWWNITKKKNWNLQFWKNQNNANFNRKNNRFNENWNRSDLFYNIRKYNRYNESYNNDYYALYN